MKILHILAGHDTPAFAEKLITNLTTTGIEQCVVVDRNASFFPIFEKVGVALAPEVLAVPAIFLQKIMLRIRLIRERPDIIQCWTARGALLVRKKQSKGKPIVIGWLGSTYDVASFSNCSHLIGATKDIVKHIVASGIRATRAHALPTFTEISAAPPIDRASLATPREARVLLSLARLHPQKGIETLLAALENLPDCIAWLAGEGPLRRELEMSAKKRGVIDRVRFLGRRTDRAALLRAADLCVLPSRVEPFGDIILEAFAAGTPVVACASAGAMALIEEGITGLLVPIGDVKALTSALRRAIDDEQLRRALVSQGYAAYIKGYTRESATRQWVQFYKSLIG